jgi:hypothetical protein
MTRNRLCVSPAVSLARALAERWLPMRSAGNASRACAALDCKNKFLPKRTDAEFCSPACRKASSRQRKAADAADAAARTAKRLAHYRWMAKELYTMAETSGLQVRFMGLENGVLAIEAQPGGIEMAMPSWAGWLKTEYTSTDPNLIAQLPNPMLGGAFINRITEQDLPQVARLRLSDRSRAQATTVAGGCRGVRRDKRRLTGRISQKEISLMQHTSR